MSHESTFTTGIKTGLRMILIAAPLLACCCPAMPIARSQSDEVIRVGDINSPEQSGITKVEHSALQTKTQPGELATTKKHQLNSIQQRKDTDEQKR